MRKILVLTSVVSIFLLLSCRKQPTACIAVDKAQIMVGESVSFTSCATDAESVSWDFGDGNKAEGSSVSHTFSSAGTYLVTMTAKSKKDKKWDKASVVITVKEPPKDRFITKITLKAFPATPPQGGTWDTTLSIPGFPFSLPGNNPEPDLNIVFKTQNNAWSTTLLTDQSDVAQSQLPITFNFAQQWIRATDENYELILNDNDLSVTITPPSINTYTTNMKTFTFNPKTATLSSGKLTLNEDGYEIEIEFEER